MPYAVRLINVEKQYHVGNQKITALHTLSHDIAKGDFWMVTGPSGCGKSTLLNLIGCIDEPDQGSVEVDNMRITDLSDVKLTRFRRERIGFIFQNFSLIPVLTALENVEYPLRLMGVPRRERTIRSREILEQVGLGAECSRCPNDLSGGQQQRVAIARALVKRPALVLADEPTANLDSVTGEAIVSLMREMQRASGTTFIFSTHDANLLKHADFVATMKDGNFTRHQEEVQHA